MREGEIRGLVSEFGLYLGGGGRGKGEGGRSKSGVTSDIGAKGRMAAPTEKIQDDGQGYKVLASLGSHGRQAALASEGRGNKGSQATGSHVGDRWQTQKWGRVGG